MDEAPQAEGVTAGAIERITAGRQVLYLTTTGRISREPREIEIWFVSSGKSLYVLAEHYFDAQWVKNIQKNSRVKIHIGDYTLEANARIVDETRDSETWCLAQRLSREKYGWGDGLPVEIVIENIKTIEAVSRST